MVEGEVKSAEHSNDDDDDDDDDDDESYIADEEDRGKKYKFKVHTCVYNTSFDVPLT